MLPAQLLEFYVILILVFLVKTRRGCSRFHSLSNHSRGTANSTLHNDFHSCVARSVDNHSQSNMQDFGTNQSITAHEVYKTQTAAKASSSRKYVVVFDIDECLCSRTKVSKANETMERLPECPVIQWNYTEYGGYRTEYLSSPYEKTILNIHVYAHIFLPYLQILFEYLLDQGVRIAFFSAGIKDRNDEVIPELLKFYWGNEKYETFRSQGQFMTFSKDDLIERRVRDPTDKNPGNCVKDLSKVIRDGETLKDIILVDDDYSYATTDQNPSICVANVLLSGEALNNVYYLYGLFKTYFENEEYKELPLRGGIVKIFSDHQLNETRYFKQEHPFMVLMISKGLSEVRKVVPKARLYLERADRLPY